MILYGEYQIKAFIATLLTYVEVLSVILLEEVLTLNMTFGGLMIVSAECIRITG